MPFAIITLWVCQLAIQLLVTTGTVITSPTATTYNGTFLSLEAWHAESLTNISWNLRGDVSADPRDRIMVFWDTLRTDILRFGNVNETIRSSSSSFSSSSSSTEDYDIFPDEMGAGSDVCNHTAYVADPLHPFDNENRSRGASVALLDNATWWYTSTLGQGADSISNSTASEAGSALVLLGDPGVYIACLLLGDENCTAADCLQFQVYQPHYDILQVHSTNIGALVTVRFNVASFDANLGDWAWILGGVDPSLDVSEANALLSSEIYSRFSEGCWFYFGRAVTLGHPFLCSRDPNSELASLQSSTSDRVYQYGWFDLYSSASGNVSLWYAIDEDYDFALVHNYYTCGLEIVAPASLVVNTTSDVEIVGVLEKGEHCGLEDGIPLRIRTIALTFTYVDIPAEIFFWGRMDSMTTSHTYLSVGLPVIGHHSVLVELESGGVLATLNMTVTPGEPYAPTSIVRTAFPTSIERRSSVNVSFASRDFYSNDISVGYGDEAFEAWTISTPSHKARETVKDLGDGSYRVEMRTQNVSGTELFFLQRNGLNIPGSPFEAYIVGSDQCVIESLDITLGECTSDLYRTVVHKWKEGTDCEGGLALPSDSQVPCSYIPPSSIVGRAMVGASIFAAAYAAFYLVWITRNRECAIVQLSQPFVCKLFLTGCILLNLAGPLLLGKPSDFLCKARPFLVHTALTFASGCLYMKTYRVHRLFNNVSLVRMSISDRSLVVWVLVLVAVDVALLTVWMILDGPRMSMKLEVYGYAEVLSPVCASGARYFPTILWAYKGGLNAFGVVMAAKTWNCADGVGESQSICLSVYNTTLLGLVNLVLHLVVSESSVAAISALSFAAVGGTVFTVSVVFGPKVYKLYYYGDLRSSVLECRTSSFSRRKSMSSTTRRNSASRPVESRVSGHSGAAKNTRARAKPYVMKHRDFRISPIESHETTRQVAHSRGTPQGAHSADGSTHAAHSIEESTPVAHVMDESPHLSHSMAGPEQGAYSAGLLPPVPGPLARNVD